VVAVVGGAAGRDADVRARQRGAARPAMRLSGRVLPAAEGGPGVIALDKRRHFCDAERRVATKRIPNDIRDGMMTTYRAALCARLGLVPFPHQAEWWLATDGLTLTDQVVPEGTEGAIEVRVPGAEPGTAREEWRRVLPRLAGRARVVAALGSFKIGKSYSSAIWAGGFAAVPGARIKLMGIEYDTCAPEFEYLLEALCSARGMNMPYTSLQNRPRDGRMWLDLANGARYEARSWERKEALKGKEDDAYVYCEAYQLPGLEAYTDFKQNLTARNGYAVFATTPDRPWVEVFHQHGHGDPGFTTWQCVCGVRRDVNPYTFDVSQKERDRTLMTAEKFAIHYEGQIGRYVGSVFHYQRGAWALSTETHPDCWRDLDAPATRDNFILPAHWEVLGAADTGTFTSSVFVALSPDGDLVVFDEVANYRYIGGKPELDESMSISTWKRRVRVTMDRFEVGGLWADQNSQFKRELLLAPNSIMLYSAKARLEQRTEVLREYCSHGKVYLAPWLEVLPHELEQAVWPPEATAGGRFQRVKQHDHTLDGVEHLAALRPRSAILDPEPDDRLWVEAFAGRRLNHLQGDPHLGVM
jgi:hypothetical protein